MALPAIADGQAKAAGAAGLNPLARARLCVTWQCRPLTVLIK